MTLDEVLMTIDGEMLVPPPFNVDVERACSSDLMSDVLLFSKPSMLLITGLTNPQVMRTADMAEAPAIVFVRGKRPPENTIKLAREMSIAILLSPYTMFETSGLLYAAGLKGIGKLPPIQQ